MSNPLFFSSRPNSLSLDINFRLNTESTRAEENDVDDLHPPDAFFHEYSDEEAILGLLATCDIINSNGTLKTVNGLKPMPPLTDAMQNETASFLRSEQILSFCPPFTLEKLVNAVSPGSTLKYVGGFVRQQILKDQEYVLKALCELTHLDIKKVMPYLIGDVLSESERDLPDLDLRVICSGKTQDELFEMLKRVSSTLTDKTEKWLKQNRAFPKFRSFKDDDICFSIIALPCNPTPIELIFWSRGLRRFLFTFDALQFYRKEGDTNFSLQSEIGLGWQSFIDLVGKIIRVPEPKFVSETAFPRMLSYFTRSYVFGDKKANLATVRDISLKSEQLLKHIKDVCRNHHGEDMKAMAALVCNASFYIDDEQARPLWELLRWKKIDHTLLNSLSGNYNKRVPIQVLLSALQIGAWIGLSTRPSKQGFAARNHGESPAIQIFCPDPSHTVLIPFDLELAFTNIGDLEDLNPLLAIIEQVICLPQAPVQSPKLPADLLKRLHIDGEKIRKKAMELKDSQSNLTKYLGFLLLCALLPTTKTDTALTALILKLLPEMVVLRLEQASGLKQFLANLFSMIGLDMLAPAIREYRPESQGEIAFINGLIATKDPELVMQAAVRWKKVRTCVPETERGLVDLQLASKFLAKGFAPALSLFKIHLKEYKGHPLTEEIPFLKALIEQVFCQKAHVLATATDLIHELILITITRHSGGDLTVLNETLDRFTRHLIQENKLILASELLEKCLPSLTGLEGAWQAWVEAAVRNPETKPSLLKKMQELSNFEGPANRYWEALKRLMLYQGTEDEGLHILQQLKQTTKHDERIAEIAEVKMNDLLSRKHPNAVSLFSSCYQQFLTPTSLQRIREKILSLYIGTGDISKAIVLWKAMEVSPAMRRLTPELLKACSDLSSLHELFCMIRDQSILPADEWANALLAVFDRIKVPVNDEIVILLFSIPLDEVSTTTRKKIVKRCIDVLEQLQIIPAPIKNRVETIAPILLQDVCDPEMLQDISMLFEIFDLNAIAISNPILISTYRFVIDCLCFDNRAEEELNLWLRKLKGIEAKPEFAAMIAKVRACFSHKPKMQARFYKEFAEELRSVVTRNDLQQEVSLLAFHKDVTIGADLVDLYRPTTFKEWRLFFTRAEAADRIPLIWKLFLEWVDTSLATASTEDVDVASFFTFVVTCLAKKEKKFVNNFYDLFVRLEKSELPLFQLLQTHAETLGFVAFESLYHCRSLVEDKSRIQVFCKQMWPQFISSFAGLKILIELATKESIQEAYLYLDIILRRTAPDIAQAVELTDQLIAASTAFPDDVVVCDRLEALVPMMVAHFPLSDQVRLASRTLEIQGQGQTEDWITNAAQGLLQTYCDKKEINPTLNLKVDPSLAADVIARCHIRKLKALGLANNITALESLEYMIKHVAKHALYSRKAQIICLDFLYDILLSILFSPEPNAISQFYVSLQKMLNAFLHGYIFVQPVKDKTLPFQIHVLLDQPISAKDSRAFLYDWSKLECDKWLEAYNPKLQDEKVMCLTELICHKLVGLVDLVPEKRGEIAQLIERYAYAFPLTSHTSKTWGRHMGQTIQVLNHAKDLQVFKDDLNTYLALEMYLHRVVKTKSKPLVPTVLKRILAFNTEDSVHYAIDIFFRYQHQLMTNKDKELLLECYAVLFNHLKPKRGVRNFVLLDAILNLFLNQLPRFQFPPHINGVDIMHHSAFFSDILPLFTNHMWELFQEFNNNIQAQYQLLDECLFMIFKLSEKGAIKTSEAKALVYCFLEKASVHLVTFLSRVINEPAERAPVIDLQTRVKKLMEALI